MISKQNPVKVAFSKARKMLWGAGLLSCAINLLMLTGPLFMLQIYDRVLTSRSVPTLVTLFALVVGLYAFLGVFDFLRARVLSRMGYGLDVALMAHAKKAWIQAGLSSQKMLSRPIRDLTTVRQFISSNGPAALLDAPWTPIYLAIVYFLHPWLGYLATGGAAIVIIAAMISNQITKRPTAEATNWEVRDISFSDGSNRNAEVITAMGMVGNVVNYWRNIRLRGLARSQVADGRVEIISSFVKASRLLIQSGILALGAYLAIYQEISAGTMIAASILAGRALAPVDLAVGNWRNFTRARQAYRRLFTQLGELENHPAPTELPAPKGQLDVSSVTKVVVVEGTEPPAKKIILQGISFSLEPGEALGVIGPSASGKSSLARLLVGLSMPDGGEVRLNGARFDQWDSDRLGRHIGYLPQSIELLAGTIHQNIARFDPDVSDEDVIEAAKLANVHELVLQLPNGYSTDLGGSRNVLSGGQSQRIALARAVLRCPSLVVLDEPNSNLDPVGEDALRDAISTLRKNGSCIIVMAHHKNAIAAVNKILVLKEGRQVTFGPKEELLKKSNKVVNLSSRPTIRAAE